MSRLSRFRDAIADPNNNPANRTLAPLPTGWRTGAAAAQAATGAASAIAPTPAAAPKTYQDFIARGQATFADELKAIEDAKKNYINNVNDAQDALYDYRKTIRGLPITPQIQAELDRLELAIENAERSVTLAFEDLRQSAINKGDAATAKTKAGSVKLPRRSKNQPYSSAKYKTELENLYRATDNQVTTLEKLYYTESRAYAAKPGVLYADEPKDFTGRINVGRRVTWDDQASSLWHEYGHHLEFSRPEYGEAAREWIKSRATGQPTPLRNLIPGSRYDLDEIAYPDKFIKPYVGKYYSDGSTEVVSMGLEHFSDSFGMRTLYNEDREHFFLILGMIR